MKTLLKRKKSSRSFCLPDSVVMFLPKERIIGAVNAIWARLGSMIFVHEIGNGCSLLKVSNVRTREVILSRPTWMIAGWLGVICSSLLGH
ncbi:unnamed protein product [Brassica oleracea var. botrytis]|nr:unnamed protein product [Brassica oleracea]